MLYENLKLMAYKTHIGYGFTNSEELTLTKWTDDKPYLLNKKVTRSSSTLNILQVLNRVTL